LLLLVQDLLELQLTLAQTLLAVPSQVLLDRTSSPYTVMELLVLQQLQFHLEL
jgi:hypothetical protein